MTELSCARRALLALLLFAAGAVQAAPAFLDLRDVAPVSGDAAAGKTAAQVCMACHGPAGVALVPAFPNLAGQKIEYLYWKLVQFKREARADSPMTALVANLDERTMRDLAAHFASLPPAPAATAAIAGRGAQLFQDGDVAKGIVPCQGCHGSTAQGHPLAAEHARYGIYPSLRQQQPGYLQQRLLQFREGTRNYSSSERLMHGVARNLGDEDIQQLVAWLHPAP